MLLCEIINRSEQEKIIQEPMIDGNIKLKDIEVNAMGFMILSQLEKDLSLGPRHVLHYKVLS